MSLSTPDNNENSNSAWANSGAIFEQVLKEKGLDNLSVISLKSIQEEMLYLRKEDSEIEKVLGEVTQRFFHDSLVFLSANLPEGSVMRETVLLMEEALSVYTDEKGNYIRSALMPSVVAANVEKGIKDVMDIWDVRICPVDKDGQFLEGINARDHYIGTFSVDDEFGGQITLEEGRSWSGAEPNTFFYKDSRTVDLIFGYSSIEAEYSDNPEDPDKTVRMVDDIGFLYIPWKFINRVGENPIEALADVVEVSFKVRDALLGWYDPKVTKKRAEAYRAEFLMSVLAKYEGGEMILPSGISKRSLRILAERMVNGSNGYHYKMSARSKVIPEKN